MRRHSQEEMTAGSKLADDIRTESNQHGDATREAAMLRSRVAMLVKERDKLLKQLGVIERIDAARRPPPPRWLSPAAPAKGHRATLCLLLTDTHFDEVVNPDEMHGINAYNRHIAELRLERWAKRSVLLARHYLAGVHYDGVCLMLGGDIFSGNIHQELLVTNADTLFGSLMHWLGPMEAAIELLVKEFGRVHIVGVPGNHGRMTRKPIMKQRAADNLDWLFYRLLARDMRRDDRLTWDITFASDAHVKVYNTRYYLEHGDNFKGGSGIAGALSPLMLGSHRAGKQQQAAGSPFDYMVIGHWHQHKFLEEEGIIAGSSLKGYDEFAKVIIKAPPRPPSQALWITTPEYGIGWSTQVRVADRKAEGW